MAGQHFPPAPGSQSQIGGSRPFAYDFHDFPAPVVVNNNANRGQPRFSIQPIYASPPPQHFNGNLVTSLPAINGHARNGSAGSQPVTSAAAVPIVNQSQEAAVNKTKPAATDPHRNSPELTMQMLSLSHSVINSDNVAGLDDFVIDDDMFQVRKCFHPL